MVKKVCMLLGVLFVTGVLGFSFPALSAPIGGGFTSGPDSSGNIDLTFLNAPASTADILSIDIDGSTADGGTIIWDSFWGVIPPAGADYTSSGVDTSLLGFDFTDITDGFNPGEQFFVEVDPDWQGDPAAGLIISDLIGVEVVFGFEDLSVLTYVFVDDPTPEAGLVLQAQAVPEPATLPLLGLGLIGLARLRRNLRKK